MGRGRRLAERSDVVRVLINQAHTFGNGGSFDNGLNFTLSMGCGTWGGNSITENLNYRHFLNITHLVTTIPEDKPSEEALFGAHWEKYGTLVHDRRGLHLPRNPETDSVRAPEFRVRRWCAVPE